MENKLLTLTNDKELRITSVELVDIINDFRMLESSSTGLKCKRLGHNDFMKKIRMEIETLKTLKLEGQGNFSQSSYINSQNKEQPCFELNRDGMLQMLNSESVFVRYKTIEYINKLEEENNRLKENQKLISAQNEIKELKETIEESKLMIADFKKATEEAKQQYKPSHKMKLNYSKLIRSLTNDDEEYDIVKQWVFANLGYTKWEDACIDDKKKIIDTINTVARLLTIKQMQQLSLF